MRKKSIIPHSRPYIKEAEINAVSDVLRSNQVATGEIVRKFEKTMLKKINMKYAVAVNSGTSALHLALISLGIKKGDAVIIPDYVCTALLNCIRMVGAEAILADVGIDNPNTSIESVENKMCDKVKAIIVPHLFGLSQDISHYKKFRVPIIEDCAQTFGCKVNNINVGAQTDISIFSFYATKLICAGEGGMLMTNKKEIMESALDLRDYDEKNNDKLRFNYRMTDINAAMGLVQLSRLPFILNKRKAIADLYYNALKESDIIPIAKNRNNIYFRFVVRAPLNADPLIEALNKEGIKARRPIFSTLSRFMNKPPCKNSDDWFKRSVSIPIYPDLSKNEISRIIKALKKISAQGKH